LRTQKEGQHSSIPSYLVASLGTCEIIAVTQLEGDNICRGVGHNTSILFHLSFILLQEGSSRMLEKLGLSLSWTVYGHGRTWIRQKASQTWNHLDRPWHGSERH
jgi:hypothetical protein